jgi:2-keto-4-pentenoate hydratase/2-oxohepta-3-ene-1,7-dioic acid hydratase in catechol pathway
MKLASYMADGVPSFGVVTGAGVISMNSRLGLPDLKSALGAGVMPLMAALAEKAKPDHKLADIRFLPAIPNPELIACAGINYRSHASETGRDIPKQPSMFIRRANTLAGHEGEMVRPRVSTSFDFEGELAVVIGRGGRHIAAERARSCRRLHLLRRWQRARLSEILGHLGQEFSRNRSARPLDRDRR